MNKEMIISSGVHETRVAILEDDQVVEVFIERENQRGVVGNVYKGRVNKILPGMQSSFIDIGLERDAFLYVSEVVNTVEEFERLAGDDEDEPVVALGTPPPEAALAAETGEAAEAVDAVAEVLAPVADGAEPAAVPAPVSSARPERRGRERGGPGERNDSSRGGSPRDERDRPEAKIEDLLKEGQDILVQVVKEPLGTKGARLTSHVTMPGRFLVFMPTVDHVGVSRKIDSREERGRLRGIVREFREQHGFTGGVIIRTAAGGRSKEDIVSDLSYFHEVWTEIRQKMEARRAPAVLFQEQSLVTKLLRDLLTDDYSAIRLDDPQEHRRVVALVERIMPNLLPRVKLYTKDYPILEEYGVQAEIDKALRPKVWLKSGGYLVINQTEALVAIDVNTGRYVGKRTGRLEDTIVKTNLEAVKGDRPPAATARSRRDHRARPHRHGREEEPAEGLPGGREGTAEGPLAVEGDSGVGFRSGDRHPQARQAEPRAPAHGAVPVLFGVGVDQVQLDDLLRDHDRTEEDRVGARRAGSHRPGEPGHRPRAQGRGTDAAARLAAVTGEVRDHQAGRPPAPRAVRRDGDLTKAQGSRLRAQARPSSKSSKILLEP